MESRKGINIVQIDLALMTIIMSFHTRKISMRNARPSALPWIFENIEYGITDDKIFRVCRTNYDTNFKTHALREPSQLHWA